MRGNERNETWNLKLSQAEGRELWEPPIERQLNCRTFDSKDRLYSLSNSDRDHSQAEGMGESRPRESERMVSKKVLCLLWVRKMLHMDDSKGEQKYVNVKHLMTYLISSIYVRSQRKLWGTNSSNNSRSDEAQVTKKASWVNTSKVYTWMSILIWVTE